MDPFDSAARDFMQSAKIAKQLLGGAYGEYQRRQANKQSIYTPASLTDRTEIPQPQSKQQSGTSKHSISTYSIIGWLFVVLAACFACTSLPAISTKTPIGIVSGILFCGFALLSAVGSVFSFAASRTSNKQKTKAESEAPDAGAKEAEPSLDVMGYQIELPRTAAWNPTIAHQFLNSLLITLSGDFVLRILASSKGIVWQLLILQSKKPSDIVTRAIRTFYPEAKVSPFMVKNRTYKAPFHRSTVKFYQCVAFPAPLAAIDDLKDYDPLNLLSRAMSGLQEGERINYTLYTGSLAPDAQEWGRQYVTRSDLHPLDYTSIGGIIGSELRRRNQADRVQRFDTSLQKVMEEKLAQSLFTALLLVQVDGPDENQVIERLAAVLPHFASFERSQFNTLDIASEPQVIKIDSQEKTTRTDTLTLIADWSSGKKQDWKEFVMVLEPRELAALWHLPYQGFTAPGIVWLPGKHTALPEELKDNCLDVCVGDNLYGGQKTPVYMRNANRATHMIVFGKTGIGKTTLLHNLIHQDIAQGSGVAVIDPHGDLVRDILQASVPPGREQDVVVWDLANRAYPPPLNLLMVPKQYEPTLAVAHVMAVFEKLYPEFGATRMGATLSMALSTLIADQTPTLLDVRRLFRDEVYRWKLIEQLAGDEVGLEWEDFERLPPAEQEQRLLPVLDKLKSFTGNSVLKPILCHPENLDLASLIQANKIILFSLEPAEGMQLPPFTQQLLGAVLVNQFQMAVTARPQRPFYLYIDEAQHFVTTSLPQLFSEARKQNLSVTLANQFLKQLAGDTLDAALGNVGAVISFQCGEPDARAILPYMKPAFSVDELVQLDTYQAAVAMRLGQQQLPAFSLNTRPAPKPTDERAGAETEARIRTQSRLVYTPKSREEVLAWLKARYEVKRRSAYTGTEDDFSEAIE